MLALNHIKKAFLSLLFAFIGFNSAIAFSLSTSIQTYPSALKQRAIFAKVILKALWKFNIQDHDYTLIEQKLAKAYDIALSPSYSVETAVQELINAIKNSPWDIKKFFLGASSSHYQIEGGLDATSAVARFYKKMNLAIAGEAIDFFNHYKDDIRQLKEELHINAFRLSLAWNRIEPQCGIFDEKALKFYKDVIHTLLFYGITPIVVFHHYDVPTWFEDIGGFEKAENGIYFREFCTYVYFKLSEELGHCFISMCNAPEGPAFKGYFTGEGTPGEKDNLHKTHTVISNMYYELVASALAIKQQYIMFKKMNPSLKKPFIGTQINVLLFDPYNNAQDNNWKSHLKSTLGCEIASYVQSGGTANFLISGEYRMFTPDLDFMKQAKGVNVYRQHKNAYKAFDWIGVNVYSNNFLDGFKRINGDELIEHDEERYTDNPNYRNYPEGIYRAVQFITENITAPLGALRNKNGNPLPIIVTENGIATKDDAKRTRYFQRALCTITQLIKDGYYVIGYTPWTSHDNYEWPTIAHPQGFDSKCYGFFAVNFDKNSPEYLKRTLKEGSRYYANFTQQLFKTTLLS